MEAPQSEYRPIWEPSPSKDPETVVYGKECDAILMSAIQCLPDLYREAVRLHLVEDRSYREINRTLQVPIGTLKTWVYRARRQLRDRMGNRVLQSVHFENWRVISN